MEGRLQVPSVGRVPSDAEVFLHGIAITLDALLQYVIRRDLGQAPEVIIKKMGLNIGFGPGNAFEHEDTAEEGS